MDGRDCVVNILLLCDSFVEHNWQSPTSLWQNKIISNSWKELGWNKWPISNISKLWKLLKEMGIPDYLTCLLRNLYAGQEETVRTEHETTDWFQIGKGVHQGCRLSPCLFNLYSEYTMRNAGLDEVHAWIKIAGRNINTSDMQMTPPLWQKVKD